MSGDRPQRRPSWLYLPLGTGFFAALAGAALLIIALLAFDALSYTYRRLGISVGWMAVIVAAALLGSFINIPVARLRAEVREISARSRSSA